MGNNEPIIGIFNARGKRGEVNREVVGADCMVRWGHFHRSWDLEGRYKKTWGFSGGQE